MSLKSPLIPLERSVIVATDVSFNRLESLVQATCHVPGVGGYKIGFSLGLEKGLPEIVACIRHYTNLPIIYDHQKAGNDIPAMGVKFAEVCARSGVTAVILLPFTGPATERAWIKACQDQGLGPIVGAHMTHERFLYQDGGSIANDAPARIFSIAAEEGVRHFVMPGNQPALVSHYRQMITEQVGNEDICLYSPGFITQNGKIEDYAKVAGRYWHAIIGSAIYEAASPEQQTRLLTSGLTNKEHLSL